MKRYTLISIISILGFVTLSAARSGNYRFLVDKGKKVTLDISTQTKPGSMTRSQPTQFTPRLHSPNDLNWVLVDSMPNAYGVASTNVNPFAYDPWANALAFIHRGHPSYDPNGGTGSIWYSYSLNNGATWARSSQLNEDIQYGGRYPSCAISNPSHSTDPTALTLEYSYPVLENSTFGCIRYGMDVFTGGIPPFTISPDCNNYGIHTWIWASDDGQSNTYFLAESGTADTISLNLFSTADQGETWAKIMWPPAGNWDALYGERGYCKGNTIYLECVVTLPGTTAPITFIENKSTNNGGTWTGWLPIDWRVIPELSQFEDFAANYEVPGSDGKVAHAFVVDANGMEHLFFTAIDTNEAGPGELMKIVELYNSSTGWKGNIIASRTSSFDTKFGDLDVMDNELEATITEDGATIAVKWVDAPFEGQSAGDIFVNYRNINWGWYSQNGLNVTNTNTGNHQRELLTHLASRMKNPDGVGGITMYLTKTTQLANIPDDSLVAENPCAIWAAKVYLSPEGITERETGIPQSFKLYSNYPNPFNPTTTIDYDIPTATTVTLKVYDVAGKEVATLVNGYQQAGKYQATFNASRFASGVYYYKLQAGLYSVTQKMLLTK